MYSFGHRGSGCGLGEEKALRLLGDSMGAVKNWRMRARFIDLHRTKVTIFDSSREHVPPWIFKRLTSVDEERG